MSDPSSHDPPTSGAPREPLPRTVCDRTATDGDAEGIGAFSYFAPASDSGRSTAPTRTNPEWRLSARPDEPPGSVRVPGYEIVGTLGRGGMGVVYKAIDLGLKRVVALKMILAGDHAGASARARFRQEAEAVARLQHPNIVQVFEVGELDGRPFCALEYVPGGTLAAALAGVPQEPRIAARRMLVLAGAMDAVHAAGLVHRDLKPANVLLAPDGTPKITDFGIAKRLDDEAVRTVEGSIMGTPAYMAPEQASGNIDHIGPAADVWSLGVMLYEMLAGHPPFKGSGVGETLDMVLRQDPVPVRRFQPRVPRDLETICLKCLEKDARKRYPRAGAMADDLQLFLERRPISARRAGIAERTVKWVRRSPVRAALTVAAVGLVVLTFAAISLQAHGERKGKEIAQRQLAERQRQDMVRRGIERAYSDSGEAAAREDWPAAEKFASTALALMASDAALADSPLRAPCEQARDRARAEIRTEAARQAAREDARHRFARLRDCLADAVVYRTMLGGLPPEEGLDRVRRVVGEGLALFGVAPDGDGPPTIDPTLFNRADGQAIVATCGQLLAVEAEALAQPRAGEKAADWKARLRLAVGRLDRADRLGFPARAVHQRRADFLHRLGDEAAEAAARARAAETVPATAADQFLGGVDQYRRGEYAAAARTLAAALRLEPGHFGAEFVLALCYVRDKKWANARDALTRCDQQRTGSPWVYGLRGLAQSELGEYAAADVDFARVLEARAADRAEPLAEYAACVNRGVSLARRGRWDGASADFARAVSLRPDDALGYVNMAQARRRQAEVPPVRDLAFRFALLPVPLLPAAVMVLHRRDALTAAMADLDTGLARRPDAALLYHERGHLYVLRGDPVQARKDFLRAITLAPSTGLASTLGDDLIALGRLQQKAGTHAAALATFDGVLAVRPDLVVTHRLRAESLLHLGRHTEAAEALDRFFATEAAAPTPPGPERDRLQAEALRLRGLLHAEGRVLRLTVHGYLSRVAARIVARTRAGDFRAAVDAYVRSLALVRDPEVLALRGWAYLTLHAPQIALEDFEEALARRPDAPDALAGRGEAQVRLGRVPEAVADAERVAVLNSVSRLQLYRAARVLAQAADRLEEGRWVPPVRAAQADAYRARAAALVVQVLERTPAGERASFWKNYVKADAALTRVRATAALARTAAEYDP